MSIGALALLLSWGYFHYYLGGAPRVIDATTYMLEARTFAQGEFSFEVPEPTASFRGRFLIHTAADPTRLAPIFPPGYPAILSLGVLLGAATLVGPLIAMGLVLATHRLALAVTHRRRTAAIAALLSALCASLRYHTAETMSHGAAALLTTLCLWATVELVQGGQRKFSWLLGACLGMLLATRQLTGVLIAFACGGALLIGLPRGAQRVILPVVVSALPGVALLLLHQHAITGSWLSSPQIRYYEFADGPSGCFELGLGSGCAYEHADVVAEQGGGGLTLFWAARNTLHRLHYHLLDVANFEPLMLIALWFAYRARKRRKYWPLLFAIVAIPSGYAFFYFSGNYSGAGARLYSELLPIWHVLLAAGLCSLHLARVGIFACLVGFSLHGSFGHRLLKSAHFGPDGSQLEQLEQLLERQTHAARTTDAHPPLVFVSTAHEFNLAHLSDPSYLVARRTYDDRERLLARRVQAPAVFVYDSQPSGPTLKELPTEEFEPNQMLTFEAEFDYPPEDKRDLWVHPEHLPWACVSRGRALALHVEGPNPSLSFAARAVPRGPYEVRFIGIEHGRCVERSIGEVQLPGSAQLSLDALRNLSHIDRLHLTPTHP